MTEFKKKVKRVQPIKRLRKVSLEKETQSLILIRNKKVSIISELKRVQNQYVTGVDKLNFIRQSSARDQLEALELAVDHAKNKWHEVLLAVKEVESQERAQIAQVLRAERDLRSIEKLEEIYISEVDKATSKQEQQELDEFSHRGAK